MVVDAVKVLDTVPVIVMVSKLEDSTMPRDRDEESGMYQTAYPPEDFVETIESLDRATTTKIIDQLGCSQRTALDRLHDLADDDQVSAEKVGNTYVWSVEEHGNQ